MTQELRRFPRIASQHVVLVKRLGGSEIEEFAATTSVGLGGCGFTSDERLPKGEVLEILISARPEVISAKARVVYTQLLPNGKQEIGVEFVSLPEVDREKIQQLLEVTEPQ
ncbi:MAG: PilZ domain-containing protein [Thermoanaerobaculia bacterium]